MVCRVSRALVSVSNKEGVVPFCAGLASLGIEILSTGGTAKLLSQKGVPVLEVSEYTGFPEMMSGRVKTLHPKIHGGILGRRGIDDEVMERHDIGRIDLVVVNLYPFRETISREDCSLETAIENIDIGGPTMIRAAAKNYAAVGVVVDPADYDVILDELRQSSVLNPETRLRLAVKCFDHTAQYDTAIAGYLGKQTGESFPACLNLQFERQEVMRYGENPHQNAAFYTEDPPPPGSISASRQLQGKALSYNNIADTDAALECVKALDFGIACVIVKHANPCGAAFGNSLLEAYNRAYSTDPTSAFGGIIAFNRCLDGETAKAIVDRQFVEVIIAPDVADDAVSVLAAKENIRVLNCGEWPERKAGGWDYKRVVGGMLVQDRDEAALQPEQIRVVSRRSPDQREIDDMMFAWKVVKFVKSNAILYVKSQQTIGIGAGQMSRVYSARIAGIKAADENLRVAGSVMASDAFFPFRDGIDAAAEAGITAVVQPGGSMRDEEVIQAADEHNIAMIFTGIRHFRH